MPTYPTSQEWLRQSSLLLEARPSTTRITSKYSIKPAKSRPAKEGAAAAAADAEPKPPRGRLVLKTFDPVGGVTLKYKTTKAAEVARLIQMLGTLGRTMAALPPLPQEEAMPDAPKEEAPAPVAPAAAAAPSQPGQQQGGGGGKGKKKKGKR
ncbi:putative wd repeat protein [Phaeoacremonium minimum UCRPA7]|uniref:Putative wd repeat protein n=1 Tax=Phaeoacremonium minimum (strain UCR-PA7) TaxID=1286976 RepID=R8BYF6_PHAM7|nr:putative wd repeat protein [Phaeoacremonium minimum UCRPA7]EOO04388.1 putative wd repeat protein [Phaeoacremonium minimum UCRPA7]